MEAESTLQHYAETACQLPPKTYHLSTDVTISRGSANTNDGTAPGHTASNQIHADEDLRSSPTAGWGSAHRPGAGAG